MKTLEERFWDKVVPEPNSGCWLWIAGLYPQGYGAFYARHKVHLAHRMSWQLSHGSIPPGQCVCHKCDNRLCVNPDHLFLGTIQDNNRDCLEKKRIFWFVNNSEASRILEKARAVSHERKNYARGTKHGRSKLTSEQVLEIRRRHNQGDSQRNLARSFDIAPVTVRQIIGRRTWRHV